MKDHAKGGKPFFMDVNYIKMHNPINAAPDFRGKSPHPARTSWVYINGEYLHAIRVDIAGDPSEPWLGLAWKFVWTAKNSWLGPTQDLGSIPAVYNLTMDPFESYDMIFNGAEGAFNGLVTSRGRYSGEDNGWAAALFSMALVEFD